MMRVVTMACVLMSALSTCSPTAPTPMPEKALAAMATQFLTDFTNSTLPADVVLRNFDPAFEGTQWERDDVEANRRRIVNERVLLGPPRVVIHPGREMRPCEFRRRLGEACVYVEVQWWSRIVDPADPQAGQVWHNSGMDQLPAIYHHGRWWLIGSDWRPAGAERVE